MTRSAPEIPATSQADPQPWGSAAEAHEWKAVARGRRRQGMAPKIRLVLDLDREQSAWLNQESKRTGLDYITLVEQLIDERIRRQPTHNGTVES